MEFWARKRARAIEKQAEGQLHFTDPYDERVYAESLHEDLDHFRTIVPDAIRSSLFLLCAAAFEHGMLGTAELLMRRVIKDEDKLASLDRMSDTGIFRAAALYSAVAKVRIRSSRNWSDARALAAIRNLILHNNGTLTPGAPKAREINSLIRRWQPAVVKGEYGRLTFSDSFVERAIGVYESFLSDTRREITRWIAANPMVDPE